MNFLQKMSQMVSRKKGRIYILDTCALHSSETMQIIEEAYKIIILTGTIKELDDHKNDGGSFGHNIRTVAKQSRIDSKGEKYECVAGYEKHTSQGQEKYVCIDGYKKNEYQDYNIIDYCKEHKNVIILTCDNDLCNLAKAYKIPYIFPKRDDEDKAGNRNSSDSSPKTTENKVVQNKKDKARINIKGIEFSNGSLYTTKNDVEKYLVVRNGIFINTNDTVKLETEDHVFKIKKKNEKVIIVEYKIVEITASMYAIECQNANIDSQEIEKLQIAKFPKEVQESARKLLGGKEERKNSTEAVMQSNEPQIHFENRWINVQKSSQYYCYINVEHNGKLIKTQNYREGDLIYLSKYNKKGNSLEIYVYKIVKDNNYAVQKLNEYKLMLVNEIYSINFSEELQEEIRSFFIKHARY